MSINNWTERGSAPLGPLNSPLVGSIFQVELLILSRLVSLNTSFLQIIEYVKDTFPYSFSFFHRDGEIPVDFPDPENVCGGNFFSYAFLQGLSKVSYICLTSLTRAKCGVRSTLCWKVGNISGST